MYVFLLKQQDYWNNNTLLLTIHTNANVVTSDNWYKYCRSFTAWSTVERVDCTGEDLLWQSFAGKTRRGGWNEGANIEGIIMAALLYKAYQERVALTTRAGETRTRKPTGNESHQRNERVKQGHENTNNNQPAKGTEPLIKLKQYSII